MKLGEWRRREGKTQQWLAEQLGVTQPFISSVERAIAPQIPGTDFMRETYIFTRSEVRPDDFYDIAAWQKEAIEREAQAELERRAA